MKCRLILSMIVRRNLLWVLFFGIFVFAGAVSVNAVEKIEINNNDFESVEEYCEYYGLPMSDDDEFINAVEDMIRERNGASGTNVTMANDGTAVPFSSSGSPLKKTRFVPSAYVADIIWTNNPITPFNHVGIYTTKTKITESLAGGVQTRTVNRGVKEYPFKIYKVTTSAGGSSRYVLSVRNEVADWAKSQVGKPYDYDFSDNKENTAKSNGTFNCSELVWKAWKFAGSVGLDSNGGDTVYPNEIKESKRLKKIAEDL